MQRLEEPTKREAALGRPFFQAVDAFQAATSRNSSQRLLFGLPQFQTTINKVFLHRHATRCCLDLFLLLQSQHQHMSSTSSIKKKHVAKLNVLDA
jgi:hypothetical protein